MTRMPQRGSARRQRGARAVLLSAGLACASHAQTPGADEAMAVATDMVAKLEEAGGCDLSLHGAPQLDELTGRWLIPYTGVGDACDAMGATLQQLGLPADLTFFRRPNADEVKTLIADMRASVRRGFPCIIGFRDEPRFDDESSLWTVRYYTSGHECEAAAEELERQGRAFRVSFQRSR